MTSHYLVATIVSLIAVSILQLNQNDQNNNIIIVKKNSNETVQQRLFRGLPHSTPWTKVNLSNEAEEIMFKSLPILNNITAQNELIKQNNTLRFTYGGFGEDRNSVWFNRSRPEIHLGVDYNNLPVGTTVHSLQSGVAIHVLRDDSLINGWGGRVIIENSTLNTCVLYGHLDPTLLPRHGDIIREGQVIGLIGNSDVNGGWFVHLHVQAMTSTFIHSQMSIKNDYLDDLENGLDGYGLSLHDGILNPDQF